MINNLPSSSLNFKSPNECLYDKVIDFSMIKIFGCHCYPNLRNYARNKLEPKSYPCVFIGLTKKYNGFKCYHITSGKTCIPRHVVFNDDYFPYKDNIPTNMNLGELIEYND